MKTTRTFRALLSLITVGLLAGSAWGQDSDGYAESFESYGAGTTVTNFTGGTWTSAETNTVIVATNYHANYKGGDYPIDYDHNTASNKALEIVNGVTNTISVGTPSLTNWVDVVIKPVLYGVDEEPDLPPVGSVAAVYFNASSNLVVMHTPINDSSTNAWLEIPDVSVSPVEWIRLTLAVNMADGDPIMAGDNTRFYQVYINGSVVSNAAAYPQPTRSGSGGTWFGSGADILREDPITNIVVKGTGFIDDLVVTNSLVVTEPMKWTIMATANTNGTIDLAGAVEVLEGQNQTFAIDADYGYVVGDVVIVENGVTKTNNAITSYTFTNVVTNASIEASFIEDVSGNNPPASWLTDTGVGVGDLDNDLRGDGMTPRQAWLASTDPTNTTFSFEVTDVWNANGSNYIEWISVFVDTNLPPFGIWGRTNLMDTTYDLLDTYPRTEGATPDTPVTNVWSESAPAYPVFYRVVATNAPSGP